MITNINYDKLITWLLPVRLRKALIKAYLHVLIYPISNRLLERFKVFEQKAWYDLKYQSGQVAHLEYVLNDHFDNALKRIYIGEGQQYDLIRYLYMDIEDIDLALYRDVENADVYLYLDSETSIGGGADYDFTVNIPIGLDFEETTIRAVIDRYKRDAKNYIIQYFI